MKFAITPLERGQVMFWDDVQKFKENGLNHFQDICEDAHGDWYRVYSDILVMPHYAKQLYNVGRESIRLNNGYYYPEEYRHQLPIDKPVIVEKRELEGCFYLRINNGRELYYY